MMVAIGAVAYRVAGRHRLLSEQLLGDYARFAAWNYSRYLTESLGETTWQVVNPILHRQVHQLAGTPDADDLVHYREQSLEECQCDPGYRPLNYFSFRLNRSDPVTQAGAGLTASRSAALRTELTGLLGGPEARTLPRMGVVSLRLDSPLMVGYGLMPTSRPDTVLYGFTFDPASLAAGILHARDNGPFLPEAVGQGKTNAELVALEVLGADGTTLYRDSTWSDEFPVATERLKRGLGDLTIRATITPMAAPSLIAGGLPRYTVPLLFGGMLLSALLAVVALVQLRREAQLARLRSEFVSSVSHELRTPLAQLRLYLDTLRLGRYETQEQREWILGHLVRETTRLEQLVESVLAFTRLERPVEASVPPSLLLAPELADAVRLFAPLAAAREARVLARLDPLAAARIDRSSLRQIVLNLLDNAVKFGPPGQRVEVRLVTEDSEIRLSVTDQGPGIPDRDRERIWEPYFRGSDPVTRTVGGSGIGLAVVREAARHAGGRTGVESRPGGGSTFHVYLPRVPLAAPPEEVHQNAVTAGPPSGPSTAV